VPGETNHKDLSSAPVQRGKWWHDEKFARPSESFRQFPYLTNLSPQPPTRGDHHLCRAGNALELIGSCTVSVHGTALIVKSRAAMLDRYTRLYNPMSVASHLNDPDHWRQRAKEARLVAEHMDDEALRQAMLSIADDYDRIAGRVALRQARTSGD
jgi:hypothetical protein